MSNERKRELLRDMRAAREELLETIKDLDPYLKVTDEGWRVHDILGHVASWDREVLAAVQAFMEDDAPYLIADFETIDDWNEEEMKRKADWAPAQVRMDFVMVRREIEHLLDQFDNATLETKITFPWHAHGTIHRMLTAVCVEHDREHAEMINDWRLTHQNGYS